MSGRPLGFRLFAAPGCGRLSLAGSQGRGQVRPPASSPGVSRPSEFALFCLLADPSGSGRRAWGRAGKPSHPAARADRVLKYRVTDALSRGRRAGSGLFQGGHDGRGDCGVPWSGHPGGWGGGRGCLGVDWFRAFVLLLLSESLRPCMW